MVVASRFGHTPEIASLDTFEEVESVPGEDGDASGDAEIADSADVLHAWNLIVEH